MAKKRFAALLAAAAAVLAGAALLIGDVQKPSPADGAELVEMKPLGTNGGGRLEGTTDGR